MAIDLLIFDLDGTLADTTLDLANSVNATRAHYGLEALPIELVSSYVGNGAPVLIRKALGPDYTDEEIQRALEYFLSCYRDRMLENTKLYPGVRESLEKTTMNMAKSVAKLIESIFAFRPERERLALEVFDGVLGPRPN